MPSRVSRRRFLAASAAVAAAPYVKAFAPGEPKEKVRLAVIGVANRGSANLKGVEAENIVALCDVDPAHAAKARASSPTPQFFTDYRKMFDAVANKVDAVVVSTPDHTHAHPSLIAMGLGKHLYCEKPLAHTVEEVRLMRQAATDRKLVTQMGTQIHAGDNYRRVVEIVQAGLLGPIRRVQVWLARKPDAAKKVNAPVKPIKFDIDQWLGPVPHEFFYAKHEEHGGAWPHFNWRYWWAFGGGTLADFGCHYMDLPYWALDLGAPAKVKATGTPIPGRRQHRPEHDARRLPVPGRRQAARRPHDLVSRHLRPGRRQDEAPRLRQRRAVRGGQRQAGRRLLEVPHTARGVRAGLPAADAVDPEVGRPPPGVADAIKTGGPTTCNFGYSGLLAEAVLLGNVAFRGGREIAWDAKAGKTDSPEADRFLKWEVRKGWELK